MRFEISDRLKKLPPYLFVEIDRQKRQASQEGRDIIDFGIGDPDLPPPQFIMDALSEALKTGSNHRYALDQGSPGFRQAIAAWYRRRFNVELNPDSEILPLIGSKEGIAHIPLAFVNPGDTVLVPDPCYPPYKGGTIFAGGTPYLMPLLEENNFLPNLSRVSKTALKRARILFINYPNNPTSATATTEFYKEVAEFAAEKDIMVCHDAAYSEVNFDGYRPPSFLEAGGSKDVGVEFHSLSKTFNMTGWRVGFVCGNRDIIAGLAKVKSNIDSGIFNAIQAAGAVALNTESDHIEKTNKIYQERRDTLAEGLASLGWKVSRPKATFYMWIRAPKGYTSKGLAQKLLQAADIVVTPGEGFGENGDGFIRMALTVSNERIKEAVERMKKVL